MLLSSLGRPLPLPPPRLRFMGEDDRLLLEIGDGLAALLVEHGLTPDSTVLDVGCGYGRLALGILHSTDYRGPYLGFDILAQHIAWCRETITPLYPDLEFRHLDIRNERYNPGGTLDPSQARFPAKSGGTDVCALFSVFTHLYRPVVERYLAEVHRVLRPGGVAVTTWLLFDEARLPAVSSEQAVYPMIHALDEETRYASDDDPLRAIAFHEGLVRSMAARARLEVVVIERGTWAGEPSRLFQDLVVLRRSASDDAIDPDRRSSRLRVADAARRLIGRGVRCAPDLSRSPRR
jgi:SAM-dependent methyltransferase